MVNRRRNVNPFERRDPEYWNLFQYYTELNNSIVEPTQGLFSSNYFSDPIIIRRLAACPDSLLENRLVRSSYTLYNDFFMSFPVRPNERFVLIIEVIHLTQNQQRLLMDAYTNLNSAMQSLTGESRDFVVSRMEDLRTVMGYFVTRRNHE